MGEGNSQIAYCGGNGSRLILRERKVAIWDRTRVALISFSRKKKGERTEVQ